MLGSLCLLWCFSIGSVIGILREDYVNNMAGEYQGPILLTWFNFNPSTDK